MVRVKAKTIANHTAVIAQSGSGKSFFLGRLLEEILVATRARCVVLDPNADFRRISEVESESLWTEAAYDPIRRLGKLPHELKRSVFSARWDPIEKVVLSGSAEIAKTSGVRQLSVPITSLSVDLLVGELTAVTRAEIEHCHIFVGSVADVLAVKRQLSNNSPANILDEAEELLSRGLVLDDRQFSIELENFCDVDLDSLLEAVPGRFPFLDAGIPTAWKEDLVDSIISQARKKLETSKRYTSEEAVRLYFARARQYEASGLIDTQVEGDIHSVQNESRLVVVDLPSLPSRASRLLAVNALLDEEWKRALRLWGDAFLKAVSEDLRVPTFIVVDEAHNLIPAHASTREEHIIREQFRTIVAEGRKYGVFLIAVTQRPDKVDPAVLGECQNKAVLRLSSSPVLELTKKVLSLDDLPAQMMEKTLTFEPGRVLLSGEWVEERPLVVYSATRRTLEGGRNLRPGYWTNSESEERDAS